MCSGIYHRVLPATNTMPAYLVSALILLRLRRYINHVITYFTRWRHRLRWRTSNCSLLLIYRPWEDERLKKEITHIQQTLSIIKFWKFRWSNTVYIKFTRQRLKFIRQSVKGFQSVITISHLNFVIKLIRVQPTAGTMLDDQWSIYAGCDVGVNCCVVCRWEQFVISWLECIARQQRCQPTCVQLLL